MVVIEPAVNGCLLLVIYGGRYVRTVRVRYGETSNDEDIEHEGEVV